MNKINTIKNILKIEPEIQKSFLGIKYAIFKNITHRKAINILLKNGFSYCLNKKYIAIRGDIFIYTKPLKGFKNVFLLEI